MNKIYALPEKRFTLLEIAFLYPEFSACPFTAPNVLRPGNCLESLQTCVLRASCHSYGGEGLVEKQSSSRGVTPWAKAVTHCWERRYRLRPF